MKYLGVTTSLVLDILDASSVKGHNVKIVAKRLSILSLSQTALQLVKQAPETFDNLEGKTSDENSLEGVYQALITYFGEKEVLNVLSGNVTTLVRKYLNKTSSKDPIEQTLEQTISLPLEASKSLFDLISE